MLAAVGYANPITADRNDRLSLQFFPAPLQRRGHQGDASLHRNVRESYQTRMRQVAQAHQFSEVGVYRHQDSIFVNRAGEQRPIAGVGAELTSFHDVMPALAQPVRQTAADTLVDQKSQ